MASRDQFQRFIFEDSQVRGAWVKLNDSYSEIGNQAPYPRPCGACWGNPWWPAC